MLAHARDSSHSTVEVKGQDHSVMAAVPGKFPSHCLVPKKETGAEQFLQKYPGWDGKGVTIAILDTGVDPGALGLQKTSHGERKIVDLIDTTGSGDVDTSTVQNTEVTSGREIVGLTGRLLHLPDTWKNPTGEWHVGIKAEFELFPAAVRSRLQEKYLLKQWEPKHSPVLAQAVKELEEFKSQHSQEEMCLNLRLEKENLEAKVEILTNKSSKTTQPGPVLDCIVFHDGESWSAVVDVSLGEDLCSVQVLKPFRERGQFSRFGEEDQVNFSVNIYDEGNLLSIVTTGGSHGTHVASIASAYVPDNPEVSGLAPGAQIISMKIGDSRLATMETSSSLIRACIAAVADKVDVMNFSYGEASHWTNKGAVLEMFSELCFKYNIVFVSSAGNNGPALSTVGCPGGNTAGIIGVGAFVSPEMMAVEYSLTHKKPVLPYTWTSRGPATDGDLGVCVTAPGGAVTSVPNWTLNKKQLMNGTSMSAPNASGCIALLLSALKSSGIPYTSAFLKKVIENTATPLGPHDNFSVGYGVLQIDKAYDAALAGLPSGDVELQVTLSGRKERGIYLREAHQIRKLTRARVSVQPLFPEKATAQEKINFELHLALVSTESWVVTPEHLALWNGARQFTVEVDPRGLLCGVHYAEVRAFVAGDPRGPLFRIPVTVIIPTEFTNTERCLFFLPALQFSKNKVHRFFFQVPPQATWAELELGDAVCESSTRITVHTIQLLPEKAFRENENIDVITLDPDGVGNVVHRVVGGFIMELCLTQYWSEMKEATVTLKLTFHSVQPSVTALVFNGAYTWTNIDVRAAFREEEIHPEFKLTHQAICKRPNSFHIKPLGSRDVLPNGTHMYELVLTYGFHVNRNTEVRPDVTLLSDLLYENPYGGQLWMIFDSNKRFICAGDAYPKHYSSKLEKGEYVLKLQIRHPKQLELKKLTDLPILLHFKLSSSITLEVAASRCDIVCGPKFSSRVLKPGIVTPVYLRALSDDKLPKHVQPGDTLTGHFTFSKQESIKKKIGYPLQYVVGSKAGKSSAKSSSNQQKKANEMEYAKALKDFKLEWMKTGVLTLEEVEEDYAEDVDFLLAKLRKIEEDKDAVYENAADVVSKLLSKVDMAEILAHFGTKADMSPEASNASSSIEKARYHLVECLLLEGNILMREEPKSHRLEQIYVDLHKLLDKKDNQLRSFCVKYAEACGHFATAAKLVEEEMSEKGANKSLEQQLIKYYEELEWEHCADLQKKWLLRKYPEAFQMF